MQFHALDQRLLSRAGIVLQALVRWFAANPADRHPTVDQLAAECQGNRKFVQRGLKDLAAAGMILLIADPAHPVNRIIDLAPQVSTLVATAIVSADPERVAGGSTPDTLGVTEVSPPDTPGVTEVSALRSPKLPDEVKSLKLDRDTFGTGETPKDGPMADVLGKLARRIERDFAQQIGEENQARERARLAPLGHLEHQGRLPMHTPPRVDGRKLLSVVADLDRSGPEALAAVETVVAKLNEEIDPKFEAMFRKAAHAIALGRFTLAPMVETIEEATHPRVRLRGPAFAVAAKRRFPGLFSRSRRPAAGPIGQDCPDGRPGVAEASIQSNRTGS